MSIKVIAGAGALVWMSAVGPVLAADIPAAPIVKAPIAVAPSQSWYGFYIGINGGYAWGRNGVNYLPDAVYGPLFAIAGVPTSLAGSPRGGLGGFTWGSNYQFDRVVIGFDSDFDWSNIKSTQTFAGLALGVPFSATATQNLKWFSTSRLRAGILVSDNWLLYATGGLASARGESTTAAAVPAPGCLVPGSCPFGVAAKNLWGYAVGGGLEYANGPWQFRAEYLHYDLGSLNYLVADPLLPGAAIAASTKFSGDLVRGAITYRFNWTPLGLIFGSDRI
jgi:outer membrane immunogenic protein